MTKPKHDPTQDKQAKQEADAHETALDGEDAIDEALQETFPASDPIAVHQDPDHKHDRK